MPERTPECKSAGHEVTTTDAVRQTRANGNNRMDTAMAGAREIRFERDDWSVKAVCSADPLFWLRVETPSPGAKAIVITDASPGSQDKAALTWALMQILAGWKLAGIERIVFTDILAGDGDGTRNSSKARETVLFLTSVLNRALPEVGLRTAGSELVERREKLDWEVGVR